MRKQAPKSMTYHVLVSRSRGRRPQTKNRGIGRVTSLVVGSYGVSDSFIL